jgi:hypothetical protein
MVASKGSQANFIGRSTSMFICTHGWPVISLDFMITQGTVVDMNAIHRDRYDTPKKHRERIEISFEKASHVEYKERELGS